MHISIAKTLSAVVRVYIWANYCVFAIATQAAGDRQSYFPILPLTPKALTKYNVNATCYPGPGKEYHQVVNDSREIWPYQVYKSSPFNPPEFDITTNGQPLASGLLFIGPSEATKDTAPMIMTETGQLVWHGPMVDSNNFRVASYKGSPVLTFWSGSSAPGANVGHGYGNITFLDSTYNEILNVCPQFGLRTPDNVTYSCQADFHESFITDRNTLLVTAYNVTQTDLSSIGGPSNGWVYDCLFFELDPKNGDILFRWSALEHVPVTETKLSSAGGVGLNQSIPFDWFHINSVVNIGSQFLVNSRHLWSTYLVSATGDIEWVFQGDTGGDFGALPPNGHFSWQHFARPHNITESSITISYFNNFNAGGIDNGTHPSNGLVFRLALPPNKSSPPVLLDVLADPHEELYSDSQGANSFLENGNFLLEYGQIPVLKEFGPRGTNGSAIRWTGRFGFDNLVQSYRGYKTEWQGFPTTTPSLAVEEDSNGCRAGFVSWNGATNVQEWVVYEGLTKDGLSQAGRVGYRGFETQFVVGQPCVQVAAIVSGKVSGRSGVVCTGYNDTGHS